MAEEQDLLAWLDAARDRDEEALSRLLAAVRGEIVSFLRGQLDSHPSSRAVAEELAQETLLRAAEGIEGCRAESVGQINAWFRTIARRQTIDRYRRRREEMAARRRSVPQAPRAAGTPNQVWGAGGEEKERVSEAEAVLGAILLEAQEELSEGTQMVVRRRMLYGDTLAEAGRTIGTTAGGARRRWQRARDRLQREVFRRAESLPEDVRQEVLRLIGERAGC